MDSVFIFISFCYNNIAIVIYLQHPAAINICYLFISQADKNHQELAFVVSFSLYMDTQSDTPERPEKDEMNEKIRQMCIVPVIVSYYSYIISTVH